MAKKTRKPKKKVTAKRTPARATAKRAGPARKPSRKPPKKKAPARPAKASAARAKTERKRLVREQRALERDVENEPQANSLADSPEYIPEAMEDSLAEELGEASVASATSGDQAAENIRDEDLSEEEGGPFVPSSARQEFAQGTDESNPEDAEPAGFPTPNARPR